MQRPNYRNKKPVKTFELVGLRQENHLVRIHTHLYLHIYVYKQWQYFEIFHPFYSSDPLHIYVQFQHTDFSKFVYLNIWDGMIHTSLHKATGHAKNTEKSC